MDEGDWLEQTAQDIAEWEVEKGWATPEGAWVDDRSVGDEIALMHSELSEALEAFRQWGMRDETPCGFFPVEGEPLPKPEGVGSEIADVFIRMIGFMNHHGLDLRDEVDRKMKYNWTRTHRHGGKRL